MNDALIPITEWIDTWADAWSSDIWRACWQGAIAVTLVWLVCVSWPRLSPRWQCWLWRLAVVKSALAILWAAPLELPLLSPRPPVELVTATSPMDFAPPAVPSLDEPPPVLETIEIAAAPAPAFVWRPRGIVMALAVWCAGVAVCVIRLARQWWWARRLRVGAGLVEDIELTRILDEERARLGIRRLPRLLVTETLVGPALVGILQPAIVLPDTMLRTLSPDSLRLLLRHELAHHVRRDLAWNLLLAIIGAVFFFHPLVWLALRRHRQTQESACDARVLGCDDTEPTGYGKLLVDVATNFAASRPNPAVTGVVGSARTLTQRLSAMGHFRPPTARATVAIVLMLSVTATVGLVPWRLVAREPMDVVGEILANWEGRGQVTSYVYQVSSELISDSAGSDHPTLGFPPGRRRQLRSVTFTRSGEKFAITQAGETGPVGAKAETKYRSTSTFDGDVNKSMTTNTRAEDGVVLDRGGAIERTDTPSADHMHDWDFIPIRFARFPLESFRHRGYDIKRMRLVHEDAVRNGRECAELVVPALDRSSNRSARIYVDRTRGDVPVGVVLEVDGRVMADYALSFERNAQAGWTIAGWSWTASHDSGDGSSASTGKVVLRSFNQPIGDSVFELTFPAGARVTEVERDEFEGFKYYVSQEDGTLRLTGKRTLRELAKDNPPPPDDGSEFTLQIIVPPEDVWEVDEDEADSSGNLSLTPSADTVEFVRELRRLAAQNIEENLSSPLVREILSKWQLRVPVQTIECEISVNNFSDGVSSDADEAATPVRGLSQKTITLARSGANFIKTVKGEDWLSGSADRVRQEHTEAFNGSATRILGGGSHTQNGVVKEINKSGFIKPGDTPANTDDVFIMPLAVGLAPRQAIANFGYDVSQIKLVREHAIRDGRDCVELVVATKGDPFDRSARIYVDRARDCVPVGFVAEMNGRVLTDYSIDFDRDERLGWTIAGWSWTGYTGSTTKSKWTAKIDNRRINRPIDDRVFELTYPAGTRVAEDAGDQFKIFVAEEDGTLRLIDTRAKVAATPAPSDDDDESADWDVSFQSWIPDDKEETSQDTAPSEAP